MNKSDEIFVTDLFNSRYLSEENSNIEIVNEKQPRDRSDEIARIETRIDCMFRSIDLTTAELTKLYSNIDKTQDTTDINRRSELEKFLFNNQNILQLLIIEKAELAKPKPPAGKVLITT